MERSADINVSPQDTERNPTEKTKLRKIKKICSFFRRKWKPVKKCFKRNRVESVGVSADLDPEPSSVPDPHCPEPGPQVDLDDVEQSCVPGPSDPEPETDVEQSSVPDPSCCKTESLEKTFNELSMLQMYKCQRVTQLRDLLDKYLLDWTPVSEVWPNVFIGNLETARDRVKLEKMGVTHILNAAASEKDLQGEINTREEYYRDMNITYYGVAAVDVSCFDISKYFFPAAEFIHNALSDPENKVLVHCFQGVSRSSTLFLAYLMIHHDMTLEDAIDRVTRARQIHPNIGFLNQLRLLNLNLVRQRKLQLRKQLNVENKVMLVPVLQSEVKLKKHMHHIMIHLRQLLEKCTLDRTPVTEVWPSVFIGNEGTAMDRVRLKEMGVTHILNAAAVKKSLGMLLGMPSMELLQNVNTGVRYYRGLNITYYGVPVTDDHLFDISKYFLPAAKFIHKALRNPENKVLLHCKDGIRRSPVLFLAYLMIQHNLMLDDAIDCIIKLRHIRLNMGFLKQLILLNSKLVCQKKL